MENHRVAVFIDFDNIRIGVRQHFGAEISAHKLMAKAARYGSVVESRAYADFTEYARDFRDRLLFAAGIQPVHAPVKTSGGRRQSSADLHMVMDIFTTALDRPDIDTVVLMTGDGDFVRMVALLRHRFGKRVVISGVEGTSTNAELMNSGDVVDPVTPADCDPAGSVSGPPRPRPETPDRADRMAPVVPEPARAKPRGLGNILGSILGTRREGEPEPAVQSAASVTPEETRPASRSRRGRRGSGQGETPSPSNSAVSPSQGTGQRSATPRSGDAGSATARGTRSRSSTATRSAQPSRARVEPPRRQLTPELTAKLVQTIEQIPPTRGGYLTWKVIEENLRAHAAEGGWTRRESAGILEALVEEGIVARMTRMRGQTEQQIGELVREHPMVQAALASEAAQPVGLSPTP